MGGMVGQRKGFKVTDADRKVRVGIAVDSYADLRAKTILKFKLSTKEDEDLPPITFQTRDGLPVLCEDDLEKLPAQTLLVWTREGQRAETDAEILYRTIREVNLDFLSTGEKVQEFFTEQMKSKVYALAKVLKEMDDGRAEGSTKDTDPDWFKGIESRAKTKEEYMFRRAQDRIRGYYYRTKDDLVKNRHHQQQQTSIVMVQQLFATLCKRLENVKYFGAYFDRTDATENSMCNTHGQFRCEGRWDREECQYTENHTINPYRSAEERLVFQTWNLDHQIERTRAIVPAVAKAITICTEDAEKNKNKDRLDVTQIFNDLFTRDNLKLVHIVCHDKGAHLPVDPQRYLMNC